MVADGMRDSISTFAQSRTPQNRTVLADGSYRHPQVLLTELCQPGSPRGAPQRIAHRRRQWACGLTTAACASAVEGQNLS